MIPKHIATLLLEEANRINTPDFIEHDPVQFPRRFSELRDIEIAAFLCASIAWGNRTMICRNCDRMLAIMRHDPYRFVMDRAYEDIPDQNIHRTFFAANMRHFLRGLNFIYSRFGSINDFAVHHRVDLHPLPPWRLVELLNMAFAQANDGHNDPRCLPLNLQTTALKRVNMALRWLVRRDGIVDLGVWNAISPSQLYIPLDVHVANTARQLQLITRRSNDRTAVIQLTDAMRSINPSDPALLDFALFGISLLTKNPLQTTNHQPLSPNS